MYFCKNCNTVQKQKPTSSCGFCNGTRNDIVRINKAGVTVTDIVLNYNADTLASLFPNMNLSVDSRGGHSINTAIDDYRYYPLGFLYNNIDKFKELSKSELETIHIKLYGKKPYSYTVKHVPVKSSIQSDYIFMPMRIETMVQWFKDPTIEFKTLYYANYSWVLDNDHSSDAVSEVTNLLIDNAQQVVREINGSTTDRFYRYYENRAHYKSREIF